MGILSLFGRVEEKRQASTFVSPFAQTCVDSVDFEVKREPSIFTQGKHVQATIWFKTGQTRANHKIQTDTLAEAIVAVEAFIKELPQG